MELFLVLFILFISGSTSKFTTEKELCDHLLKNYNNQYRPVRNSSHVVEVKMQLGISQILELVWKDEYLEWNTSDYDAQMLVTIPKSKIWGMDLYVKNSVGDTKNSLEPFHRDLQSYTLVAEGGNCVSYHPFVLHTSCEMDTAYFPFDVQTCSITAGSWIYDSKQLKLSLMDPSIIWEQSSNVGEWELTETEAVINVVPYDILIGDRWQTLPYDEVTFSVTLTRNPSFYINNIVIPTAMLGVVAIFSFLLPPESGERISLCLTTLLAIAVYAMVVADNVPESSRDVPLITCLLFLYMTIMAASTLWSVLATRFYFHAESYTSPPGKILQLFTRIPSCPFRKSKTKEQMAKQVVRGGDIQLTELTHQVDDEIDSSDVCIKERQSEIVTRWRQVIVGLDMALFIIFLIVLIVGTLLFLM